MPSDAAQRLNQAGAASIPPPLDHLPPPPPPSSGVQPTTPGPFHAVVRGPNGLDVTVSGPADVVAAQLRSLADALDPRRVVLRTEPLVSRTRDGKR